jgi:phage tail tape-measure protein
MAKAQAIILAELNKEFGGSAQAQMETYGGKVQALNTKWANFKEQIGNLVIPILVKVIDVVSSVIDSL